MAACHSGYPKSISRNSHATSANIAPTTHDISCLSQECFMPNIMLISAVITMVKTAQSGNTHKKSLLKSPKISILFCKVFFVEFRVPVYNIFITPIHKKDIRAIQLVLLVIAIGKEPSELAELFGYLVLRRI